MKTLTEWLSKMREMEKAATPVPWHFKENPEWWGVVDSEFRPVIDSPELAVAMGIEDARVIPASRNALPLLLDAIEAAQKMADAIDRIDTADGNDDACAARDAFTAAISKLIEASK